MEPIKKELTKGAKVAWAAYFQTKKKLTITEETLAAHKEYVEFLEGYVQELEEETGRESDGGWYVRPKISKKI